MSNARRQDEFSSHEGHRSRLRARYAKGGMPALADYEFVELLLSFIIPRVDVKPIAKELLKKFANLRGIIDARAEDLVKIKGVGENSALALRALHDLVCAYHLNELEAPGTKIGTISKLINYFKAKIGSEPTEVLELACFDAKLKIIPGGSVRVCEGSVNSASVDIRKIIEIAIKMGASSIAISHNHPSGDPTPSLEDIRLTRRLSESCKPIGINLIEHIVIGKKACFSFRRDGRFDDLYDDSIMEGRLSARRVAEERERLGE